ncbi:MAG: DinB family protein [Pseudomonadota bacterium]
MKAHFEMFAAYNHWANARLFEAANALSDTAYHSDEKAFFGSVHGTLNHLLVGDRIWMRRFTGQGPDHRDLNEIIHEDRAALAQARKEEDHRIIAWVDGLSEADLSGDITYMPITTPREIRSPLAPLMAHFFNHQTHHRGQAHALLTRLAGTAPSLDLVYFNYERMEPSN